jgi:AcrR family transcriptional regulator
LVVKRRPRTARKETAKADANPRSLQLLWRPTGRSRRGPEQALSREGIVLAAIEIADAEGLLALSMARLAERLGCATMSLYRHVANKDELQVFMMDTAPGSPPALAPGTGWRRGLELWARALQAVYYRHPWILQIVAGRPPLEPGQLAWLEAGLQALKPTHLVPGDKLSVILLVLNYVRGEAQIKIGVLQAHRRTPKQERQAQAWYARTLAQLVDAERFPALAEVIAAGVFSGGHGDVTSDPSFDFGLARLLDGVQVAVCAAQASFRSTKHFK